MKSRAVLSIALILGLLAGCGGGDEPPAPRGAPPSEAPRRPAERAVGQEIWITYFAPDHPYGRRTNRTREDAEALAGVLHREVVGGADVGPLARRHSNAPGGAADGFSGLLPGDPDAPDARDRALLAVPVGGVTPVIDWRGGYWFAKRISLGEGATLQARFEALGRRAVRLRVLALLYRGVQPEPADVDVSVLPTKERAVAFARELLDRALAGESFAALASRYTHDARGRKNGGILEVPDPDRPGAWTDRVRPWSETVPQPVLEAALETSAGAIHPDVIVSDRGVFLVEVIEQIR